MKEAEAMSGVIEPVDWQQSADELHEMAKSLYARWPIIRRTSENTTF